MKDPYIVFSDGEKVALSEPLFLKKGMYFTCIFGDDAMQLEGNGTKFCLNKDEAISAIASTFHKYKKDLYDRPLNKISPYTPIWSMVEKGCNQGFNPMQIVLVCAPKHASVPTELQGGASQGGCSKKRVSSDDEDEEEEDGDD